MDGESSRGRRVYHLVRTAYTMLAVFALAVLGVAVWGFNIVLKERDVWFALGAVLPLVAIGIEMLVKSLRTRNSEGETPEGCVLGFVAIYCGFAIIVDSP